MNLLQIDIGQSRVIPFVSISLVTVFMAISFIDLELQMASYLALVGTIAILFASVGLLLLRKTLHTFDIIVLLYILILEVVSAINENDWKTWLWYMFAITAYLLIFNYYEARYRTIIQSIIFVLSIAIYCQLYQCVTHPEMWLFEGEKQTRGFLLGGNYNGMGIRMIIALTASMIGLKYSKWIKINLITLTISCFAILFMVRSMTSLSGMFLLLFLFLIKNKKLLLIGAVGMYVGAFLFQTLVCFSGTGLENNEFASWLVKDVMEKDLTFSYRTYIWDAALRVFAESPIWGYGYFSIDWFKAHIFTEGGMDNFIICHMIYGGIILLSLYTILVLKTLLRLTVIKDLTAIRLMAVFGVLCIMMLFEAYDTPLVFLLLTMMYYYPHQESCATLEDYAGEKSIQENDNLASSK